MDQALALWRGPGYDWSVQEFLGLQGASGAAYRFRLVSDPARLPMTSGNFVYVRWRGPTLQVFCCGAVNNLQGAAISWDEAVRAMAPWASILG